MQQAIIDYRWIALGLGVGTVVGIPLGTRVPMTAMPQRIAIALTFGASAATLVGIAEYHDHRETLALGQRIAVAFEVMLGSLTVAGSFVAAGKLQEVLPSRPLTYRGQNAVNFGLMAVMLVILGAVVAGKGGMCKLGGYNRAYADKTDKSGHSPVLIGRKAPIDLTWHPAAGIM
jgi:NAD(P) transhydrogenase subunit beta